MSERDKISYEALGAPGQPEIDLSVGPRTSDHPEAPAAAASDADLSLDAAPAAAADVEPDAKGVDLAGMQHRDVEDVGEPNQEGLVDPNAPLPPVYGSEPEPDVDSAATVGTEPASDQGADPVPDSQIVNPVFAGQIDSETTGDADTSEEAAAPAEPTGDPVEASDPAPANLEDTQDLDLAEVSAETEPEPADVVAEAEPKPAETGPTPAPAAEGDHTTEDDGTHVTAATAAGLAGALLAMRRWGRIMGGRASREVVLRSPLGRRVLLVGMVAAGAVIGAATAVSFVVGKAWPEAGNILKDTVGNLPDGAAPDTSPTSDPKTTVDSGATADGKTTETEGAKDGDAGEAQIPAEASPYWSVALDTFDRTHNPETTLFNGTFSNAVASLAQASGMTISDTAGVAPGTVDVKSQDFFHLVQELAFTNGLVGTKDAPLSEIDAAARQLSPKFTVLLNHKG